MAATPPAGTPSASGRLGAMLQGIDLARGIRPEVVKEIQDALWRSGVLVLRGQEADVENLLALGRAFGHMEPHSILHYRHPEHEQLSFISNVDNDGKIDQFAHYKRASDWHTDGSFKRKPDTEAFLYSVAAPTTGGATMFADMRLAYETLPAELRSEVDGLRAFHKRGEGWRCDNPPPPLTEEQKRSGEFEGAEHPLVVTHPATGRRSLYINPGHTAYIVGMTKAESDALLDQLYEHAIKPDFLYQHYWKEGDLLFWDQRSVMHKAGGGVPPDQKRIMIRGMMTGTLAKVPAAA